MIKKIIILLIILIYSQIATSAQTKIYLPVIFKYVPKAAFIGDSYTLGNDDELPGNGYGFAGHIQNRLNINSRRFVYYHFSNTFDNWQHIEDYQPDVIILELGIHSINRCDEADTIEEFTAAVDKLIRKSLLITDNNKVVYVGIPWRSFWSQERNAAAQEYNIVLAQLADNYNIKYVDVYDDLYQCGGACTGADLHHPNDAGHNLIANNIIEELAID